MNKLLYLLPALLILASCKDEEEPIPSYIKIEPFVVNAVGGADWQKITEGWLYVNDEFLGAYSLPATVPVLAEGEASIQVFPGVKENGLVQTPALYPFFEYFDINTTLSTTSTTLIQPETNYFANAIFPWPVDRGSFNGAPIVLENRDGDTATTFVLTTTGAFEGRSVKMAVDTAHARIEIATEVVENLPTTGDRQVWLEMHYRNDMPFELWLLGTVGANPEQAQPVYQFAPSADWNKIYINLTEFLVGLQQQDHRLFFRTALPIGIDGEYEQESGEVFLDNIRLIHF